MFSLICRERILTVLTNDEEMATTEVESKLGDERSNLNGSISHLTGMEDCRGSGLDRKSKNLERTLVGFV